MSTSLDASPSPSSASLSPAARYRVLRVIGRGSFGVVSLCEDLQEREGGGGHSRQHSSTDDPLLAAAMQPSSPPSASPSSPPMSVSPRRSRRQFVMKQIALQSTSSPESRTALQEVRVLKALHHPFIVRYHDSWLDEQSSTLCVVMHYCAGGDLHGRIRQASAAGQSFSEGAVLDWFIALCLALRYCHDRRLLHRDIKSQNVFLSQHGVCRLGDFGIARVLSTGNQMAQSVVGTPYSLAPEVCQSQHYSYAADVWALGCVLYETCALRLPFEAGNLLGLVWKIVHEKPEPIDAARYSPELWQLLQAMLSKEPQRRPSVKEILLLPFIQRRVPIIVEEMKNRNSDQKRVHRQERKDAAAAAAAAAAATH